MSEQAFHARIVRCPTCGGEALYAADNPSRPFCSPRCKNNDFGAWASEAYGVVAEPPREDEPAAEAPPQRASQ